MTQTQTQTRYIVYIPSDGQSMEVTLGEGATEAEARADAERTIRVGGLYNPETGEAPRYIVEPKPATYRIAFMKTDGSWDIWDEFEAADDAEANAVAERDYAGQDWYVLDADGNNINA